MTNDAVPIHTKVAQRWFERRTFAARDLPSTPHLAALKRARHVRISVAIPALNESATIGDVCSTIRQGLIEEHGLVDELLVIDGDSTDDTARIATAAGARLVRARTLLPEVRYQGGKGESLWRSLVAVSGDIVVWVDADIRDFREDFVARLVAPMLVDPTIDFVKGFYERPIASDGSILATGGGRVTELLARPLLNTFFPELGGFLQPLAGEYAGRVDVLKRISFMTGYSVEVGLLIDLLEEIGLERMAQVDLDVRLHRNRSLVDLGPMAHGIARTILRRAQEWRRIAATFDYASQPLFRPSGRHVDPIQVHEVERPPIDLTPPYIALLRANQTVVATAY